MAVDIEAYKRLKTELDHDAVVLVAVSKTRPQLDLMELYQLGHRDFGENYVQELVDKEAALPKDIRWHFIGHLQGNKVKYIAPFVHLIHGIDSLKLLKEIDKQAAKVTRIIDCLLQVHIATEETKFGMVATEIDEAMHQLPSLKNVRVIGLMGMASFTDSKENVRAEFKHLKDIFNKYKEENFRVLSMGMSGDYTLAIAEGSTMVRVGSLLFGEREKK